MSQRNDGWENHREDLLDFVRRKDIKSDYVVSYQQAYSPFITRGIDLVREAENGFKYSADHPEVARVMRELSNSSKIKDDSQFDFGEYVNNATNAMSKLGVDPEIAQTIAHLAAAEKIREQHQLPTKNG